MGLTTPVYFAFYYSGTGGGAGESSRWTIDNVIVEVEEDYYNFQGEEDQSITNDSSWTPIDLSSTNHWYYDTRDEEQGACGNNFGAEGGAADDWLVSPPFALFGETSFFSFLYYEHFDDALETPLTLLVTDSWTGDVETTTWVDITPDGLNGSTMDAYIPAATKNFALEGADLRLAIRYQSTGTAGGETKRICVDKFSLEQVGGPLVLNEILYNQEGGLVSFSPQTGGGIPPLSFAWDFGDDSSPSVENRPQHRYVAAGAYEVTLAVTDSTGASISGSVSITVTQFEVPTKSPETLRIAAFNMLGFRPNLGDCKCYS